MAVQERLFIGAFVLVLIVGGIHDEDFVVAFCQLLFALVERSNETLLVLHGVRGPLQFRWGEECVTDPLFLFCWATGRDFCREEGPHVQRAGGKTWEFDATMGFPGEDGGTLSRDRNFC